MRSTPIKILDIRDSPWVDGPGRTILQCASMVNQERYRIFIGFFTGEFDGDNEYMISAKALGLQVVPFIERRAIDFNVIRQILKVVQEKSIQIIHTHEFRSNLLGLICAKLAGIPLVSTCHGWIANTWKRRLFTRIDQSLLRYFSRVIAVSEFMSTQLQGFGLKPYQIRIIRNALVIEHYQPGVMDLSFRESLGLDRDTILIGNIGRLSPEKGQAFLLEAAEAIIAAHNNVFFVFIGIGPERATLQELCEDLEIEKNVIFAGFQKDMLKVYRSLDLVVQSSYTEGMPNVILESLLMEVPVLATRVGGTAEVIEPSSAGTLIQPNSLGQLIQGIENFIQNPTDQKVMAQRGRRYVAENFNHKNRVSLLMDLYDNILLSK